MKTQIFLMVIFGLTSSVSSQSPGNYATVNGLKMYYEVHGSGFPLVLIHGGGSTIGTTFGRVLPSLAKNHKVIAVELQAHGHTGDRNLPLGFEQDADDVAELLRQLHIPLADIFGFSNGASTTLQMAIRHPGLVRKIIVASTMYKKDGAFPGFWDLMKDATFEGMPQAFKDAFLAINPDKEALYTMFNRDVARMQTFKDIGDEQIKAITAPALIIAGNADVVRVEHCVEMYRMMQHAQLAILPGGHGDYIGEITSLKPGQNIFPALEIIERFLREE